MPIIRDAIKYGALFGVAHEAGKAINKHDESKNNNPPVMQSGPSGQYQDNREQPSQAQQQQQYHQQPQQYQQQPEHPPQYQQTQQWRDANGYLHQPWCNGQCQSQCNRGAVNDGK